MSFCSLNSIQSLSHIGSGSGSRSLKAYFELNNTTLESISNLLYNSATTISYNTVSGKTGVVCNGLNYDASSTSFIVNFNIPTFSITASNGVSISLWFYINNYTNATAPVIFAMADTLNWLGSGYMIALYQGSVYFNYANYNGLAGNSNGGSNITINTWYHVVGVFNGTTTGNKIYINGIDTNATNTTNHIGSVTALNIQPATNVISIGTSNVSSSFAGYNGNVFPNFNGIVSKVGIYNTILTPAEISILYNYP